jgi:hypothetical protein
MSWRSCGLTVRRECFRSEERVRSPGWNACNTSRSLPRCGAGCFGAGSPMFTGRHPRGDRPQVAAQYWSACPPGDLTLWQQAPLDGHTGTRPQPGPCSSGAARARAGPRPQAPGHPEDVRGARSLDWEDRRWPCTASTSSGSSGHRRRQTGQRRSVAHAVTDRAAGQDCDRA